MRWILINGPKSCAQFLNVVVPHLHDSRLNSHSQAVAAQCRDAQHHRCGLDNKRNRVRETTCARASVEAYVDVRVRRKQFSQLKDDLFFESLRRLGKAVPVENYLVVKGNLDFKVLPDSGHDFEFCRQSALLAANSP